MQIFAHPHRPGFLGQFSEPAAPNYPLRMHGEKLSPDYKRPIYAFLQSLIPHSLSRLLQRPQSRVLAHRGLDRSDSPLFRMHCFRGVYRTEAQHRIIPNLPGKGC
jgi:hypothetical protein